MEKFGPSLGTTQAVPESYNILRFPVYLSSPAPRCVPFCSVCDKNHCPFSPIPVFPDRCSRCGSVPGNCTRQPAIAASSSGSMNTSRLARSASRAYDVEDGLACLQRFVEAMAAQQGHQCGTVKNNGDYGRLILNGLSSMWGCSNKSTPYSFHGTPIVYNNCTRFRVSSREESWLWTRL